jgi:hypothetical protein
MSAEPPKAQAKGSGRWWALLLRRICLLIAAEVEHEFDIEPKR